MTATILGFIAAALIAAWGYRHGFLTPGGAVAACIIGGCVWYGGRWGLAVPLVFFFVASSLITRWSARRGGSAAADRQQERRVVQRNIRQVTANGAVAAACALIGGITGESRWLSAGLCSLAAMTGDTWSSEIGRVLAARPFDLRSGRRVEAGISGAVSWPGTVAGLLGTICTAGVGVFLLPSAGVSLVSSLVVIAGIGFAAVWFDSLLGATAQLRYVCDSCKRMTDARYHCGHPARRTAGIPGFGNNMVNFLTTIFAAAIFLFL